MSAPDVSSPRWLLLIHQIPPKPAYLRVKVGRRLARIGAVALKNSVYLLPRSESALEDLQWVRGEVVDGGGDATIVEAQLVDGLTDAEVVALFHASRDQDYALLEKETRALTKRAHGKLSEVLRSEIDAELARISARLEEIGAIDFFGATGRVTVDGLMRALRERLSPSAKEAKMEPAASEQTYRGRTWVTRTGIRVDRIASAWLIKRFIDPKARFKFVPAKGYAPERGELRFDMFEAEFSHEGDACTFEVLRSRMSLDVPGLVAVAEVVHDIDLKDEKYRRPETAGVAALIAGLCLVHSDDVERLERGEQILEQLLASYASRKDGGS